MQELNDKRYPCTLHYGFRSGLDARAAALKKLEVVWEELPFLNVLCKCFLESAYFGQAMKEDSNFAYVGM